MMTDLRAGQDVDVLLESWAGSSRIPATVVKPTPKGAQVKWGRTAFRFVEGKTSWVPRSALRARGGSE